MMITYAEMCEDVQIFAYEA